MNRRNEPIAGEQNQDVVVDPGATARPRAIRDHLAPMIDDLSPGIVAPEIQAPHFELKPVMFNMLNSIGQFGGSPREDARQQILAFLESWADLCRSFLMRYNPPNMHTQLRNDIASFRQADDESVYECWDRYKGLLRKCNNHGFQEWTQVVMFYNGVNAPTRMMLDASANGTLLDKSPEEAFDILDRIAKNDYQFLASRLGPGRRTPGKLDLDANDSLAAQLSAITNMLKNLQRPTEVQDARAVNCVHCEGNHNANNCPTMHESASYVGNYNRNAIILIRPPTTQGGGNTIISHGETKVGNTSTSHNNSLEATMQEFISSTKTLLHDHSNGIKNQGNLLQTQGALLQSHGSSLRALENQVGQIAQALQVRPQGGLPSDTEVIKRNGKEKCSALTFKSGKEINKENKFGGKSVEDPTPSHLQKEPEFLDDSPIEEDKGEKLDNEKSEEQHTNAAASAASQPAREEVRPPPPFPQ
ncbi:hypothetical protein V6N13_135998 [Hibiscus sabdariffa]